MSSSGINPWTQQPYSAQYKALRDQAKGLPVFKELEDIMDLCRKHQVVIVEGETGSGKTTQIPQAFLADLKFLASCKKIALTQTKRLATDESMVDDSTLLEVLTDGTLLAIAKTDRLLSDYSVIIIDEAHQHTEATDLLLGLLKKLLASGDRPDLRVIIMSATIDTKLFLDYFPGSVHKHVEGRTFPVKVNYLLESVTEERMDEKIVDLVLHVHLTGRTGNILVFASGAPSIRKIVHMINEAMNPTGGRRPVFNEREAGKLVCYPLYATLPPDEQDLACHAVAEPDRFCKPTRKVIVSTNMAETSVTLSGVSIVIDSGLVKNNLWDPVKETFGLKLQWASKAVAKQRSGRAGRTAPGVAYRMCSQKDYHGRLTAHTIPDMQNSDMLQACLTILDLGHSPFDFPYICPPASETVTKALGILEALGAITWSKTTDLVLTKRGAKLSKLPVDIYSGVMLLESMKFRCQDEALTVVAMLESTKAGDSVFASRRGMGKEAMKQIRRSFGQEHGDHIMFLNIYLGWREACRLQTSNDFLRDNCLQRSVLKAADDTRKRLISILWSEYKEEFKLAAAGLGDPRYYTKVLANLVAGFHLRVAKRVPSSGKGGGNQWEILRTGRIASISEFSCQPGPNDDWIVFGEYSTGDGKWELREVTPVPLDLMLWAEPLPWCQRTLAVHDHVSDSLTDAIVRLTGQDEGIVRTIMPPHPNPAESCFTASE
nr:hypothetical protein B0A51_02484 [Rachicladosporium sp. CCFEE 5018]